MPRNPRFKQSYRSAWESLPELRGWLQGVPNEPTKAYCRICNKTLYAHRLSLLQHSCTVRHSKLAQNKYLEDRRQKAIDAGLSETITIVQLSRELSDSNLEQPETIEELSEELLEANLEQPEPVANDVLNGVVDIDLNSFDGPAIDEFEAPNLYINSLPESLPDDSCFNNSCVQVDRRPPISTHVLDTSKGTPVQNLEVSLYQLIEGRWTLINDCVTNPDGRCDEFVTRETMTAGRYKLHFDVDRYFQLRKQYSFYPFIEIAFDVQSPADHHHIPLILSPFGYSTYKGS